MKHHFALINLLLAILCFEHSLSNRGLTSQQKLIKNSSFQTNQQRNQASRCLPLSECKTFLWLVKNVENLPPGYLQSRVEVFQHLRDKLCGYRQNSPMVNCPIEEEIPGDKLPGPLEGDDEVVEARVVTGNAGTESFCEGGVVLHHLPRSENLRARNRNTVNELMQDIETMTLRGLKYAYLGQKRLENRDVIHVDVHGNCCWSIYDKSMFRGQIQYLPAGFSGMPEVDPMSLRRELCIN